MAETDNNETRHILIASANPLFARGLERMINQKCGNQPKEIRLVTSMEEVITSMKGWHPELIVVDVDDRQISRSEFLLHFISSDQPLQVLLVSLDTSGSIIVYERRQLNPEEAEDWLSMMRE